MTAVYDSANNTVKVNVDCTPDIVNVTLTEGSAFGSKVAPDTTPSNDAAFWIVSGLAAGTYTLYTVGYNKPAGVSGGQNSTPASASVTVPSSGNQSTPTASFGYTASKLVVQFTDQSTDQGGSITSYNWDFGDGQTSTAQNPSHTYANASTYTVKETVIDNNNHQASTSQQVTVSSGSSGGGGGSYQVNAAPTGPTAPSDGWKVVAADAFNNAYPLSNLWFPNRAAYGGVPANGTDAPSFGAPYEIEVFNSTQVSLGTDGCELTAVCIAAKGSTSAYRSGAISSRIDWNNGATLTNLPPGYAGLQWKPLAGQIIVLESVMTLPTIGGADTGYWTATDASSSGGVYQEIDYFEQHNYNTAVRGYYGSITINAWFSPLSGSTYDVGLALWTDDNTPHLAPFNDGLEHRWTHVYDGNAKTVSIYIDGKLFTAENPQNGFAKQTSTFAWPSNFADQWWYILYSFGLRDTGSGLEPPYVLGQGDVCRIRSFAMYVNGSANISQSIQAGGIAPGTTVA